MKKLAVFSMGLFAPAELHGGPLQSDILGGVGMLSVETDVSRVTFAAARIDAVKIGLNVAGATLLAEDSIGSIAVGGSITDSRVLVGYNFAGQPLASAAEIGKVKVSGNWIASDLVAGVAAGNGFFGDIDDTLAGPGLTARIAKIVIKGAAFGTVDDVRDHFGFVTREIGAFKVGKAKLALSKGGAPDVFEVGVTGDVTVREVA
ncbi:MAG: hypothetical protein ABI680_08140 [Chthoniobacteraceae bacterium]